MSAASEEELFEVWKLFQSEGLMLRNDHIGYPWDAKRKDSMNEKSKRKLRLKMTDEDDGLEGILAGIEGEDDELHSLVDETNGKDVQDPKKRSLFQKMMADREEAKAKMEEEITIANDAAFPSVRDELERKLHETIESLVTRRQQAMISPEVFANSVDTLLMAVSGLTGNRMMAVLSELENMAKNERQHVPETVSRHFVNKSGLIVVLVWKVSYSTFQAQIWEGGEMSRATDYKKDDAAAAFDGMVEMAKGLVERGFTAI